MKHKSIQDHMTTRCGFCNHKIKKREHGACKTCRREIERVPSDLRVHAMRLRLILGVQWGTVVAETNFIAYAEANGIT